MAFVANHLRGLGFLPAGETPKLVAGATSFGTSTVHLGPPDINNSGAVALGFPRHTDRGPLSGGIFTGPDLVEDKVIAVGDALFGSTVTYVAFGRGLNNNGQIAFTALLADGRSVVARADPTGREVRWKTGTGGSFGDAGNWDPQEVPLPMIRPCLRRPEPTRWNWRERDQPPLARSQERGQLDARLIGARVHGGDLGHRAKGMT